MEQMGRGVTFSDRLLSCIYLYAHLQLRQTSRDESDVAEVGL